MEKILFVINTLTGGGAERVAADLSVSLSERYEIDLLVNDDTPPGYPYRGRILSLRMKPEGTKKRIGYQLRLFFRRVRRMKQLRAANRYRAVVSFSEAANLANILTRGSGGRTIVSVHISVTRSAAHDRKIRMFHVPAVRALYRRADCVVGVSRGIVRELTGRYGLPPEKVVCAENGVDLDAVRRQAAAPFTEEEREWLKGTSADADACGADDVRKLIVNMGRLTEQKGQEHLIRALRVLKKENIRFRLLILGAGELEAELKALTEALGLSDDVVFCGFRREAYRLLSAADLAVLPSAYEGYPVALAEAVCCGIPCVSSDFVSGARSILCGPEDPEALPEKEGTLREGIKEVLCGLLVPVCGGAPGDVSRASEGAPRTKMTLRERTLGEAMARMLTDEALRDRCRKGCEARAADLTLARSAEKWIEVISR